MLSIRSFTLGNIGCLQVPKAPLAKAVHTLAPWAMQQQTESIIFAVSLRQSSTPLAVASANLLIEVSLKRANIGQFSFYILAYEPW